MSRILPLPEAAIAQIHSSKHITSLKDVVLALLENSLDAHSTKIELDVDFRRGSCTAEDDGDGVPAAELGEGGGLGRMYHTSKRLPDFDKRHEFHGSAGADLASLASLSLLSVTSKPKGAPLRATVTMHQGKVISRRASTEGTLAFEHGTRVSVRDLFGNMPVRVKQRALAAEDGNDDEKAWHQLKHGIVALLLAWHSSATVRLADSNHASRKVRLSTSSTTADATLTRTSLRQLDSGEEAAFGLQQAFAVLFQSGLCPPDSRPKWIPISASAVDVTVKGLICLDPAPTRQCQFISLGIHPLPQSSGHSSVYEALNKLFADSSFGTDESLLDIDVTEMERRKRDRRYKADGYTQKQLHGRKGVDRRPMFVLQVTSRDGRRAEGTSDNMSDAMVQRIINVLEATATQWLAAHHFRPWKRASRRRKDAQDTPSPALSRQSSFSAASSHAHAAGSTRPRRAFTAESMWCSKKRKVFDNSGRPHTVDTSIARPSEGAVSPFAVWSRIKSGKQINRRGESGTGKAVTAPERWLGTGVEREDVERSTAFVLPAIEAGALSSSLKQPRGTQPASGSPQPSNTVRTLPPGSSDDFGSLNEDDMAAAAAEVESCLAAENDIAPERSDDIVDWVGPKSKQKYRINARTGIVLPNRSETTGLWGSHAPYVRQSAGIKTSFSSKDMPFSFAKRARSTRAESNNDDYGEEQWLPGFLQQWNNPVFVHNDEKSIPVALPDGPSLEEGAADGKHRCGSHFQTGDFGEVRVKGGIRLTKDALRNAKVIRQVDRKFILCKSNDSRGDCLGRENLMLVDQHAASERVILEELFAEVCTMPAKTILLEKPLHFQISGKEHGLFEDHKRHFADWGIEYVLSQRVEGIPTSQDVRAERRTKHLLTVKGLPPGIVERCALVPRILIEMLRSEIYIAADTRGHEGRLSRPTTTTEGGARDEHPWLSRIGHCPAGIIELLNSRACRSAIMFNDELSVEECEGLMGRLGRCAFPFMCAHGRVSMVPLVELAANEDDGKALAGLSTGPVTGFGVQEAYVEELSYSAAFPHSNLMDKGSGRNETGE